MNQKPLRGVRSFSLMGQALVAVQKQGLCRSLSYLAADGGIRALRFAWKARLVWYWRWSPIVPNDEYDARDAACMSCERQKVTGNGRFCQQCGCADWRWSELTVKNTRKGHFCPLGKHPGQISVPAHAGGCKGCSGRKTNGQGAGAANLQPPAATGRAGNIARKLGLPEEEVRAGAWMDTEITTASSAEAPFKG